MLNLNNPPKFDAEVYTKIGLNDLVVYAMHFLHTQGIAITSEDIVSACFTLFPERFSLRKYSYWPDSTVVSRHWSECRRKGFLTGSVANGFKLTAKGSKFAEKVEKTLGGLRPTSLHVPPTDVKTRAGKFVRAMETSDAFRDYRKHSRHAKFNEFEFRSMLLCTLESTPETLKRNLDQFREYADIYTRQDLIMFLNFCEDKFSYLLDPPKKRSAKKMRKAKGK